MPNEWRWDLEDNHWIELKLTDVGLSYTGWDWTLQSGGGYMAGFQSVDEFLRDGPLKEMPESIAAGVRHALADLGGHLVTIALAGPKADEVHCNLDGRSMMLSAPVRLFEGRLAAGSHRISGVALYPGADSKGRRNQRTFECTFDVTGPIDIVIDDLVPRWA